MIKLNHTILGPTNIITPSGRRNGDTETEISMFEWPQAAFYRDNAYRPLTTFPGVYRNRVRGNRMNLPVTRVAATE
jgi:hypothetical protein